MHLFEVILTANHAQLATESGLLRIANYAFALVEIVLVRLFTRLVGAKLAVVRRGGAYASITRSCVSIDSRTISIGSRKTIATNSF